MKGSGFRKTLVMLTLTISLLAAGCISIGVPTSTPTIPPATPPVTTEPINPNWSPPPVTTTTPLAPDLAPIVAKVRPAVVAINVELTSFNILNQPVTQAGAASGWIIDSNGLIVTNNHVVEGATNITISLADGRSFAAQQVASDAISDLAVIKINATGLPVVTVGDSSRMQVGMVVATIGNSLGEGIRMTGGYVSALGVSVNISTGETLYDLIETDAAINPGNSGGPLINTAGEVIGITNSKLVGTGVELVGFAISTNSAMPIITDLIQQGYVVRPYIGVSLQTVTPGIAFIYGLAVSQGALITSVAPNSPASNAGLQQGDVIVKIGNTDIVTANDAAQAIQSSQIGRSITITYWRGKTESTVNVTPTQSPAP